MTTHLLFPVLYEGTRLLMAAAFLFSGVDKLLHWRDGMDELARLGIRSPLCAGTQLAGGVMLVTGPDAWPGAGLLACFTYGATALGHRFWLRTVRARTQSRFTTKTQRHEGCTEWRRRALCWTLCLCIFVVNLYCGESLL